MTDRKAVLNRLQEKLLSGEPPSVVDDVVALLDKAAALVESVYDDNAAHGDILSRKTIAAADVLRHELGSWK